MPLLLLLPCDLQTNVAPGQVGMDVYLENVRPVTVLATLPCFLRLSSLSPFPRGNDVTTIAANARNEFALAELILSHTHRF